MPRAIEFLKVTGSLRSIPEHLAIHLTDQEGRAVRHLLEGGMTQREAARAMRRSQPRVAQLLKTALAKMTGQQKRVASRVELEDVFEHGPTRIVSA